MFILIFSANLFYCFLGYLRLLIHWKTFKLRHYLNLFFSVKKLNDFLVHNDKKSKNGCENYQRRSPVAVCALNDRIWKSVEPKTESKR